MVALIDGKHFISSCKTLPHRAPILGGAEKAVQNNQWAPVALNFVMKTHLQPRHQYRKSIVNRIGGAAALAGGADQRRGLNTVLGRPPTGKDYERSFLEACESIAAGDPWRAAHRNKAHGNQCAL